MGPSGPDACRYPLRDAPSALPPSRRTGVVGTRTVVRPERPVSALHAGNPGASTMVPHWLDAAARERLAGAVRVALDATSTHPVTTIHLQDVLTELHVAAARDAVWPASTARVRLATGWKDDVLPVRLSADELAAVLGLPGLPDLLRDLLGGRGGNA